MNNRGMDELTSHMKSTERKINQIDEEVRQNRLGQESIHSNFRNIMNITRDIQQDFHNDEKFGNWLSEMDDELTQQNKKINQLVDESNMALKSKKSKLDDEHEQIKYEKRKLV